MTSKTNETYHCYVNDYCFGCGACISAAPLCFVAAADRGAAVVRQPDRLSLLDFREAQEICPVGAIVLEVVPPDRRLRPRKGVPEKHA